MDEKMIKAAVNKAIRQRLERTPDGYYIPDDGKTLYALLAGHPPFRGTSAINTLRRVMDEPPPPIPLHPQR